MDEFKYRLRFFVGDDSQTIAQAWSYRIPLVPQIGSTVWLDEETMFETEANKVYYAEPLKVKDINYSYGKTLTLIDVMTEVVTL